MALRWRASAKAFVILLTKAEGRRAARGGGRVGLRLGLLGIDMAEVAIAGKYCETGDILIQKVSLPLPRAGDLVAVPVSGAYQLAMASNYNMAPRPAVVVVADGAARLVRPRETYDDLLAAEGRG